MTIENFEFARFDNVGTHCQYIRINDSIDFLKILSFGFYQRPGTPGQNVNIYGIPGLLNTHAWVAGWYFGVNYRLRCQNIAVNYPDNIAYASLVAPRFMAHDWKIIPHYFGAPADQGVDFFKALDIHTGLVGPHQVAYQQWRDEHIANLPGINIDPLITIHHPADLSDIIREAKLCI